MDGKARIKPRHIMLAVRKDPELTRYFKEGDFSEAGAMPTNNPKPQGKKKGKQMDDSE